MSYHMIKTVTISVSKELKKDLEKISKAENKPVSDIVWDSLITYLSLLVMKQFASTLIVNP
jgi:predicted transcriptional regulator